MALPLSIGSIEPRAGLLQVALVNGAVLDVDLRGYPRLEPATPEQLSHYELVDDGCGAVWPALYPASPLGMLNVYDLLWDRRCEAALSQLKTLNWRLEALDVDDREVVALWRMEADINNGGFLQFFGNWAEPTFTLALMALEALGATEMPSILRKMRAMLDRFENSQEAVSFDSLAALFTKEEHTEMQYLDEAFWKYPDRLSKLATLRYVKS